MTEYTQDQIDRANAVCLADFLLSQGEQLEKSGREYRWKLRDSLTLRDNKWYRHSQSKGGYPVAFVMEFYNKTFPEAVRMLIGEEPAGNNGSTNNQFRLPAKNDNNDTIIKYLTEERCLDKDLVGAFLMSGDIYEDAEHHNVIFVGRDRNGIPRYATARGTQEKFRQDILGSDKSFGFSFEGTGHKLLVFEAPIDLLSFICLYPKDWQTRSCCSLGGVSGKTMDRILSERKDIDQVFLCLDSDEAGNNASLKLTESIPETITVTRLVPARKDWNDVLIEKNSIENRRYISDTIVLREAKTAEPVPVIRMSEVTPEKVEWLWHPYIPFGKLTLLQGNPGEGKTYFAMELAAACTNRKQLPDTEIMEPFNVIYQTAEDALGDTVHPRLTEVGADLDRVLVINDTDAPLSLSDDRIEKAIVENSARLLVIDPVQAFIGSSVDMNRANEVRPILRKLGDMAQRTKCAVILIGHLNKSAGTQSTYRGLGSIDITAAVRSVLLIGRVKKDPNIRVICHDKSSLAPEGYSIAFTLSAENGFEWIGQYEISADDLLNGKSNDANSPSPNKQKQARKLILELLSDGKEVSSDEIDRIASKREISARTIRVVKSNLREEGIFGSRRIGTQWYHSLIQQEDEPNWNDPHRRLNKASEILGLTVADITDRVQPVENTVQVPSGKESNVL